MLDAPLLLEAGWGPMCDFVLMVDVPREIAPGPRRCTRLDRSRIRLAARPPNGRSTKNAASPTPSSTNDGTEAELRDAVRDFWQRTYRAHYRPDER